MRKVELLAPAGDLEKLKIAFEYGADAVYIGGEIFGMRSAAKNFTKENMIEGVNFAHERDKKVFVTCNIIPRSEDLELLRNYLLELDEIGVDAVIVSDPGVFKIVRETIPNMEIHISTQASTTNYTAANFWYNQGAQRIVTARELSFGETKEIREHIPEDMDIEAFVHGAMCMSYSGKCTISNYTTGRDANKGSCAQSCRWKYTLMEEKDGEYTPVIEDIDPEFFFNTKDLCMIEYIPELVKSGIYSFKIEGRMKSPYYVAAIVKAYREALDKYWDDPEGYEFDQKLMDNLLKVSHRRYHTGFYFGKSGEQVYESSSYIRDYDIVGVVRDYNEETKVATIEQRNRLFEGDTVEVLTPVGDYYEIQMNDMKDEKDEKIDVANKAQMIFKVKIDKPVKVNDMLIKCKEANS